MRYGQIDGLLLLLLAAALWATVRGRWPLSGVVLALATALKLYPAFLLVLALRRRRSSALAAWALTLAALTALTVALFGWAVHWQFASAVLPQSGGGTLWVENQTINGWLNRLLVTDTMGLAPSSSPLVDALTYAAAALLTTLALLRARRLPDVLAFSLLVVTLLVVLPAAWIHYQVLLIIPMAAIIAAAERAGGLGWRVAVPLVLSWSLLCFGNQWTFFGKTLYGPFWELVLSYKLYGLLLLWATLGWAWPQPDEALAPTPVGSPALVGQPT